MDTKNYQSGASDTPPLKPTTPSVGYPQGGDPSTGTPATVPGAFWFYKIATEMNNVIEGFGLTPTDDELDQFWQALRGIVFSMTDHVSEPDPHPQYSLKTHNHDNTYASIGHNHDHVYVKINSVKDVYLDVSGTGNTTNPWTAHAWALQAYAADYFVTLDRLSVRYRNSYQYYTGNANATGYTYHIANFNKTASGWNLVSQS